ncbi:MAG: DUF3737 family protein [Prevotella sp.]|nr:DUF3737 family protein [Prevotella sp.]
MQQLIKNSYYEGERPLFATRGLRLENVVIGPGESALKECADIEAVECEFQGKYPFWHVDGFTIDRCLFREGSRAALWYSRRLTMRDTKVEAPKMFREMEDLTLENVVIPDAEETLWHCRGVRLTNVEVENADYLFMHSSDINIAGYRQKGNYSFQYCRNVEISDSVIYSKDAFWGTEDVTVRDSEIHGEYLGWHSRRLRLINCRISGTQPLCYATDLVMENCVMDADCDLAFECSTLQATVNGRITSVKNPRSGSIKAEGYGEIIIDGNLKEPGDCVIA